LQIFYGCNTFRFSIINGHMIANLFVGKIYKAHFSWLTSLAICMPFRTQGKDGYWANCTPWSRRTYDMVRESVLFQGWWDKHFDYEDAFEHLGWNLLRAVRFRKLVLVLPGWYKLAG
jgi:hypothetical protein